MLLFSYTLRRNAWSLIAFFLVGAALSMLWMPQAAIMPYPSIGMMGRMELYLPLLFSLPLSFLLHDKSTIELSLVQGVRTLRLFAVHFFSLLIWMYTALLVIVLSYRSAPLSEEQMASTSLPIHIPEQLKLYMLASVAVTLLFFCAIVVFLRVLLRNCYAPVGIVLFVFTMFYERSRSLRRGGTDGLGRALFDPFISCYLLGDRVPAAEGFGHLWSGNRLLFLSFAFVLLAATALLLRRERLHE